MWAEGYWIDEEPQATLSIASVSGLLFGLALGATAALLLAPSSGAVLRRQVKSSARRFGRRAAEAYDGASQAVGDVVAKSRRAVDAGREAYQSARSANERTAAVDAPPF
jgi:gas vesicle protein